MAFIRNTDKLIEGSSKLFFSEVRARAAVQSDLESLSSSISSEQSARQSEDSGIKLRLDVIEGGAGVSGSIAKAQADAQAYADQKVAALVNSAPSVLDTLKELSDAIGGDASFAATVAGQIGAVDDKVDQEILDRAAAISALQSSIGSDVSDLEAAIEAEESRAMLAEGALDVRLDVLEADPTTKSYVDGQIQSVEGQVSSEQSRAQAAEGLLDGRLDVLEQDPTTKAYVDGEVSGEESRAMAAEGLLDGRLDVLEQDPTTKSYVDGQIGNLEGQPDVATYVGQLASSVFGAISSEQSRAEGEEALLDGRIDVLEADPTTKAYVDGEVSDLQGQITQEISDRQSAISSVEGMVDAEEVRAMAAEGLLDGRLDVLEQDPTTKTYVDGEVAAEETRAMAAESALDVRLDALELDPVSKTYVDGEVSDLQGQVNTEKGRIDAILSASEADKDSFAEIVSLINSVDTANDSAFAGYVLSNDAALAQEVSDRQAGDSALDARLDIIEGLESVEGSVAKAEKDAKDYADAAVLVEKNRAETAEGLLDGRLDVLESDPTTKTYVDGLFPSKSTSDLAEGSNLYYTQARFNTAFAGKSSSDLAEGSKLFFTDARAKSAAIVNSSAGSQTDQGMSVSAAKSYIDTADNARLKLDGTNSMTAAIAFSTAVAFSQGGQTLLSGTSASGIVFNRGQRVPYQGVSANSTVNTPNGHITGVTSVTGGKTITLMSAVGISGRMLIIKDESGQASASNYIRITPQAGQLIDGESYYDIVVPYESVMVYSNGFNWFII